MRATIVGERTDRSATAEALARATALQARDAVALALAAGTLPGPAGVALGERLSAEAEAELRDLRRLGARTATLGAPVAVDPPAVELPRTLPAALRRLEAMLRETLEALVAAIPADADDLEGEATEHLLEHVIHRKRSTLELLQRAQR